MPQTLFSDELISELQSQIALNPFENFDCDPTSISNCKTNPEQQFLDSSDAVCAFRYHDNECWEYSMITYENEEAAL